MSCLCTLSISSAASHLLKWAHEQRTSETANATPRAARSQIRVYPGSNAPLSWLRAQPFPQKLFFRSREHGFEVAAIGFARIVSGDLFTEHIQSQLVSMLNDDHPQMRFFGGCRFDGDRTATRDVEWAPYRGFTFVLPAVELYSNSNDEYFLAANYCPLSDNSSLTNALRSISETQRFPQTVDPLRMVPRALRVADLTDFQAWNAAMADILRQLDSQQYEKIVLARRKKFFFNSGCRPNPTHILAALEEQNRIRSSKTLHRSFDAVQDELPHVDGTTKHTCPRDQAEDSFDTNTSNRKSYLFCLQLDNDTAFLGCTPERLFLLEDGVLLTEALAGTVRRGNDVMEAEETSELLSQKNLDEHAFVVDYIRSALSACGVEVETNGPHIRRLPRLMHLATDIRGHLQPRTLCEANSEEAVPLSHDAGSSSLSPKLQNGIFDFLQTMHPTPAVCGLPRERTIAELRRLEDFDRGFYGGPFGWFSSDAGEFCVAIRSALIHGDNITAFGGSGIVQASESKSEWDETELKMSAFTDMFSAESGSRTTPEEGTFTDSSLSTSSLLPSVVDSNSNGSNVPTEYLLPDEHGMNDTLSATNGNMPLSSSLNRPHLTESSFGLRKFFDPKSLEVVPNLNTLWGCLCVEELCRNGVNTFFVSPGSRSAPLAVGVMKVREATYFVTHDERGSGFLAVGYARATGRAAAVITSSGTAVANLLPAVAEASMDSLPMILITADRPPELRDVGANQAIHQVNIFGQYVLWSKDFSCPSEEIPLRNLLSDVDYGVFRSGSQSLGTDGTFDMRERGPVHLNMMFREKLAPDKQAWDRRYLDSIGQRWKVMPKPLTRYVAPRQMRSAMQMCYNAQQCEGPAGDSSWSDLYSTLHRSRVGLIIAAGGMGCPNCEDEAIALYEISNLLGWPIVSDVCGGLRFDSTLGGVAHYGDQIFASPLARKALLPDAVLQFGERITSKRIIKVIEEASGWHESNGFAYMVVSESVKRCDPSLLTTHRLRCSLGDVLENLKIAANVDSIISKDMYDGSKVCEGDRNSGMALVKISDRVDARLQELMKDDEEKQLTEPWCARVISEVIEKPSALFIGNSMPIRDFDAFGRGSPDGLKIRVAANRGASGIDGILSSGIGYGVGLNLDVTIVVGDMSSIHDINALHLLRANESKLRIRVTVVVVNNGGGGIFSMLPIVKHEDVFSPLFNTPHRVEFRGGCEMFGVDHCTVRTAKEMREVLAKKTGSHRVIEAVVGHDHLANAALHQRLRAVVVEQVTAVLGATRASAIQ